MGEITAASQEQTAGIEQINQAITQMDNVTQQNAALVEEAAAAADSLQGQAKNLSQVVSVFTIGKSSIGGGVPVSSLIAALPASIVAANAPNATTPIRRPSVQRSTAKKELPSAPARSGMRPVAPAGGDWDEF